MNSPKHVAIIMDGNGRWGIKKIKSRNYGHSQGVKNVEKIINTAIKLNIKYLTLYTFSTENWKRPKKEIRFLILLLEKYIDQQLDNFHKKKVKLKIIGNINKFPKSLKKKLRAAELKTKNNYKLYVNIALNYGSKEEIVSTVKKLNILMLPVNEKNISNHLYTKNIPDPEILIRTGETYRLSNFLLWQLSYTEIFFVKKLWPDFNKNDFKKVIIKFNKIRRNFGAINE
ncbi:MAG: di-trans,poly-cis-decaprenylcistransferase [Candidatus Pelagibacter sp.]|nr:di-trans,poly-cis-decaprenylcistransferase [Candidatus Pelagibacter sp.]